MRRSVFYRVSEFKVVVEGDPFRYVRENVEDPVRRPNDSSRVRSPKEIALALENAVRQPQESLEAVELTVVCVCEQHFHGTRRFPLAESAEPPRTDFPFLIARWATAPRQAFHSLLVPPVHEI